ncbi:hypothetical protein B0H12DRAFT_1239873 [Mycena haematopus]|nr:hypothetical protein B0H12DRAFT_1241356 [Mycena haematopus]KAJ7231686.1 hypothetical protein B0H12DRAFT_1239873 [Mycena haematopus]
MGRALRDAGAVPYDAGGHVYCVGDVNRAVTGHKNLESSNISLLAFGNGDGGGGPLPKMLENLRTVTNTHHELPPVNIGHSVDAFFEYLAESSRGRLEVGTRRGQGPRIARLGPSRIAG